ncbi:MAG: dynamin family protein [Euzebya sp.]
MTDRLRQRLNALSDAVTLLQRHGLETEHTLADVEVFLEHADGRLRHGTDHTVVALVGSTGSGKSSLLNAIAGTEIARVGVTRPTTAVTQAVTFGRHADGLLDLIGVSQRHHLSSGDPALKGLVLLDLPDFDSVTVAHRLEVDRLVGLVDLLLWVTDPQKYADEALHVGYLQPLQTHAEVMQVVLNKTDLLQPDQRQACLADLARLLAGDGLGGIRPLAATTTMDEGIGQVRHILAQQVQDKQASLNRIDADLRARVIAVGAVAGTPQAVDLDQVHSDLAQGLAGAVGVEEISDLVAAQYRRDAKLATGWPPLRFLRRFRRAPLADLTPTTGAQIATAEVSRSLRQAAHQVTQKAGPVWGPAATQLIRGRMDPLTQTLDSGISRRVQVLRQPPRWWRPLSVVQRLFLAVAVLGGLWLLGIALAQAFLLLDVDPFTPYVGTVPLPTALLLGGIGAGLLAAGLARLVASAAGRRQAMRATTQLRTSVAAVAEDQVMDPLRTMLADAQQVTDLLDVAARRA